MSDKPAEASNVTLGVLDRLLAYMNAPWKAAVMVVLLIVGGIGYLVYTERARIADAVLHEPITRPVLAITKFTAGVDKLLRDTRADLAVLAEINLNDNVAIDRIGIDRDGTRWVPIEGAQPALYPESNMNLVIRFLHNEVVCSDTEGRPNADLQALNIAGYLRTCLVSVPPILGTSVGAVLIAWKTPLAPAAEARAGIALATAAMTFATW